MLFHVRYGLPCQSRFAATLGERGEGGGGVVPPHGRPAGTLQHHAFNYAYTRTYTSTPNPHRDTYVHNPPSLSHAGLNPTLARTQTVGLGEVPSVGSSRVQMQIPAPGKYDQTSTTKLFPQNGQRRVASSRSRTTLLSRAELGSPLTGPPPTAPSGGVPASPPCRSPSPRLSPSPSPLGGSATASGTGEGEGGGRSALRLQPTHVRTIGVASRYEVTQQRAVAKKRYPWAAQVNGKGAAGFPRKGPCQCMQTPEVEGGYAPQTWPFGHTAPSGSEGTSGTEAPHAGHGSSWLSAGAVGVAEASIGSGCGADRERWASSISASFTNAGGALVVAA